MTISKEKVKRQKSEARATKKKARAKFLRERIAEKKYSSQLRQVARQVGSIIRGFAPNGNIQDMPGLIQSLQRYANLIEPWAKHVATQMIAEVSQRNSKMWAEAGREIGQNLKQEIEGAEMQRPMADLLQEQVTLIKSLPIEAAERVNRLTMQAAVDSTRASEVAKEIMRSGKVTESRAMLIARTETGRASSAITQTRSEHLGSEAYIWRTAGDLDVREQHKHLAGKVFRWDDPPVSGPSGERSHPGAIYNCRCFAEPILPESVL